MPPKPALYSQEFKLEQDPILFNAGISIKAVVITKRFPASIINGVERIQKKQIQNKIIFIKGQKHASVDCVHTAINTLPLDEIPDDILSGNLDAPETLKEFAESSEMRPVRLSPKEHFKALVSYVSGIVEVGLVNCLRSSYYSSELNPESMPFGFNFMMHSQILNALSRLSPPSCVSIICEILFYLRDQTTPEWLESRFESLTNRYSFSKFWKYPAFVECAQACFPNNAGSIIANIFKTNHNIHYLSARLKIFPVDVVMSVLPELKMREIDLTNLVTNLFKNDVKVLSPFKQLNLRQYEILEFFGRYASDAPILSEILENVDDSDIIGAILQNPSCPSQILERLSLNPNYCQLILKQISIQKANLTWRQSEKLSLSFRILLNTLQTLPEITLYFLLYEYPSTYLDLPPVFIPILLKLIQDLDASPPRKQLALYTISYQPSISPEIYPVLLTEDFHYLYELYPACFGRLLLKAPNPIHFAEGSKFSPAFLIDAIIGGLRNLSRETLEQCVHVFFEIIAFFKITYTEDLFWEWFNLLSKPANPQRREALFLEHLRDELAPSFQEILSF